MLDKIKLIVLRTLDNEKLAYDDDLREFGMDSITFVKIVIDIEEEFNIVFPVKDLDEQKCKTIRDLSNIINEQLIHNESTKV